MTDTPTLVALGTAQPEHTQTPTLVTLTNPGDVIVAGRQVLAFAHIHDPGTAPDGVVLTPVASSNIESVTRTATGIYDVVPAVGIDATHCALCTSYLSETLADLGILIPFNVTQARLQTVIRADIGDGGGPENGAFTIAFLGELVELPSGGTAQFGTGPGNAAEGNDPALVNVRTGPLSKRLRVDASAAVPNAATTDVTVYTTTALTSLERVLLVLDSAIVGAGSCVASLGATFGGQEYILNVTLTSATPVGVVAGETLLSLGAAMAASQGFEAVLAAAAPIKLRLVTTGAITAGSVRVIVCGEKLDPYN